MNRIKAKVYVGKHCEPCKPVKNLIEKGHFDINGEEGDVEMVDIESEEGFVQIFDGLDGIPAAYKDGKQCKIRIEGDSILHLECPDEEPEPDDSA